MGTFKQKHVATPNSQAAQPRPLSRNTRPRLSPNSWVGVVLIALAALSLSQTIQQALTRDLTGLETTLFSAITFVLSSVGSFIISAHFNQLQARKEYEQLARPALRRVDSLQQALTVVAAGVNARLTARKAAGQGASEEITWLEGLMSQLQLLSHNIKDANSDWREMLPEDYEDALQRAFDKLTVSQESIAELKSQIDEQKKKKASGDETAQAKIAELEKQLAETRHSARFQPIFPAGRSISIGDVQIPTFGSYGSSDSGEKQT